MKKRLVFFTTLAVLALGLASCFGGKSGGGKKYTVEITNKEQLAEIMEDDTSKTVSVVISDVITLDAYQSGDLVVTSDDETVLTIAGNNKIRPVAAGQTTVRATYKNKFSDSVEVTIKAQQALQEVSNPLENTDYILSMVPKSGTRNYAVGGMEGYYLKSGTKIDDAATARVVLKQNATDDYKYSITLTYNEAAGEVTKTIGGCKADGHINIGYVEDATTSKPFATSYFKVNTDNSLSTMIDGEEFWIGTYSTYYTFSFRNASQIAYKAKLYGYMDAIHATSVDINETEVTIPVDGAKKLTATMLPENTTDTINWVSENKQVATIDAATGLLVGVSEGTAKIHANAFKVSDEITITVSGSLNYGTEAEPLTVAQAKTFLDTNFADGTVTVKEMYITGTVSSATYDAKYKNWTIWLYDGETAQGFELYATSLKDGLDSSKLLDGAIVKAHGYAKLHNGTTYELTNVGSTSYPLVYELSYTAPELTGVEVTPETASVDVADGAATKQLTVAPVPSNAELGTVTYLVTPETDKIEVSDTGLVTVAQDIMEEDADALSFTITATCGTFTDTCTLTVTRSTSGGGEKTDWDFSKETITVDKVLELDPGDGNTTPDWYYVAAQVKEITSTQYGNGTLQNQDGSKTCGLYGLYSIDGSTRYDSMSEKPVANDVVILYSQINNFKGTVQLKNARLAQLNGNDYTSLSGIKLNSTAETVKKGESVTLTVSPVPSVATLGEVTWTVEGNDKVTVDDGVVSVAADAVVDSTATVKATCGAFSATCVITVADAGAAVEKTVTILPGAFSAVDGGTTGKDIGGVSGDVSITAVGTTTADQFRVFKGKTMSIKVAGGTISKIVITCTANGTTKQGPGCWGAGAPTGYTFETNGATGTWVGSLEEVLFTATDNQVRITQFVITYSL